MEHFRARRSPALDDSFEGWVFINLRDMPIYQRILTGGLMWT